MKKLLEGSEAMRRRPQRNNRGVCTLDTRLKPMLLVSSKQLTRSQAIVAQKVFVVRLDRPWQLRSSRHLKDQQRVTPQQSEERIPQATHHRSRTGLDAALPVRASDE